MIAAIVWLVVIIVIAIAVVMMMPKTPTTEAQTANVPEVLDGRKIRKVFGTVWIDDPTVLGWKPMGTIAIKSKGKK